MTESATGTGIEEMRTLALAALGEWDLAVTNLVPLKVRENAVFRVDLADGGRAVVRVHRRGYHTDEELESEFAWLRALAASGIAVAARHPVAAWSRLRGGGDLGIWPAAD